MKIKFSSLAIGLVAFACLLVDFSLKNWDKEERVIEWDVHSYYEYLPALFIYDDIKFEKSDYRLNDGQYLFWPVYTDEGKKVIKMTMGTAFFYAPFFFAAHAYASLTDYPEDGFSEPYKFFLLLSTVFFLILGLDILRKVLAHFGFEDGIITLTILLLGLGTNLLCYASQSAPMSHVYSFCLFAAFTWGTIKWYQDHSVKHTVLLGLLWGWITLVRPTNAILIFFFLLYGLSSFAELQQRLLLFRKHWLKTILFVICAFIMILPQLIYWKFATGKLICYSYNDEGFFFGHPRILEGLFSWRKGWFVYTPLIVFAFAGLYFLKGETRKVLFPLSVFMILNIYIIFSWWCWWYGGTLGQRSFIESYSLLAIPLASLVKHISNVSVRMRAPLLWVGGLVAVFLIWLNIFQTYQFEYHSLHHDGMTKELYFRQFGKMDKVEGFDSMVRWPYYDSAKKGVDCEIPLPPEALEQKQTPGNEFLAKEISRRTIQLKASNGKFVCADESINNFVIANRDSAQGWETFSLIEFENDEYNIRSHRNKIFTVEEANANKISAVKENAGGGIFYMVWIDKNHVAFKNKEGKYWRMDKETKMLYGNGGNIGEDEKFEIIQK